MIELHSQPTPNGQKVMIMLEETGLAWKHIDVNIRTGDQFKPDFLKLNPNNKIPAIVDTDGPGGRYAMMESGAILIYLAGKSGRFLPRSVRGKYDVLQWLMFQMASVGPMFGQAGHFTNQAKEGNEYARNRYVNEAKRLYRVLDNRLAECPWLGGRDYSIADMATYPWTKGHKDRDVGEATHPHFMRWFRAMEARPAVQRVNALAADIRERMARAAEGKEAVNIYDTRDNAERLAKATGR
jgi:GST-like protein